MSQTAAEQSISPRLAAPYLVRRLRSLHEDVAHDFAAALSVLLRTSCTAAVTGVEQPSFGHFLGSIESPACLYLLKADPLDEQLMLDVEPTLMYSMIDRLLGGSGNEPPPGRPMTEIEQCVAARVVRIFCQQYAAAWKSSLELRLDVLQMESNPQSLGILPPAELAMLVTFDVILGDLHGRLRLCLPRRAIERVASRLLPSDPLSPSSDAALDVTVTLAATSITGRELNDLRPGDIIATETAVGGPVLISIANQPRFHGKPGQYQGRKAVVILEPISPPPESVGDA